MINDRDIPPSKQFIANINTKIKIGAITNTLPPFTFTFPRALLDDDGGPIIIILMYEHRREYNRGDDTELGRYRGYLN